MGLSTRATKTLGGSSTLRQCGFYDGNETCYSESCERPVTVLEPPDPVPAPFPPDQYGLFLKVGIDLNFHALDVGESGESLLHISFRTGAKDLVYVKYGPASGNPNQSPCVGLGVSPNALVTRFPDNPLDGSREWLVSAEIARVEEWIGNKGSCKGYVYMPVTFWIREVPQ